MPTYRNELRVCKICGKPYHADVLTSSNTFSQSIESINAQIRRHVYWLCDECWEKNENRLDNALEKYIPNETDYMRQKDVQKSIKDEILNKNKRFEEYNQKISPFDITSETYSKYLFELFHCLSNEVTAQKKPFKLYLDEKELTSKYYFNMKPVCYLFDPTQKGPNISIRYDLSSFDHNHFHLFPKIIIDSGYYYMMVHGRETKVTKTIFSHGANWEISVEMQKKIRELMNDRYSWMESSYLANEIRYHQHIYFSTSLIDDMISILDRYYSVFGEPFEKIRMLATTSEWRITVDENFNIIERFTKSGMRLFDPPYSDVENVL